MEEENPTKLRIIMQALTNLSARKILLLSETNKFQVKLDHRTKLFIDVISGLILYQLLLLIQAVNNQMKILETSVQKSRSRQHQDGRKSLDSKRGIFTSKLQQRPNANPYLESSLPGFKQSFEHSRQGLDHHRQFFNSREFLNVPQSRNHFHMNSVTNRGEAYHKTPPPEVRFNYINNSRQQSPIKYIPISNHPVNKQATQHLSRSFHLTGNHQNSTSYYPAENVEIRKTFIPQHIYNHIPANNIIQTNFQHSEPKAPHSNSGPGQTDQAYNLLLRQYQKLFSKFQSECELSKELQTTINSLKLQLKNKINSSQINNSRDNKSSQNYSINIQRLHDKLYKYYEKYVDHIVRARKQKCISRVSKIFESAHQQINVSVIQQSSSYNWVG